MLIVTPFPAGDVLYEDACEGKAGHLGSKARLKVISSMSFALISLADPLGSNYREHGRARSWLSVVNIPALISYIAEMST